MVEWILTVFAWVLFLIWIIVNKIFIKKSNNHKSYEYSYDKGEYMPSNNISETSKKLMIMKDKWEKLGITPYFSEVHNFSNEKFNSKAPDLCKHYDYCIDKNIQGENIQTLKRCLKVAELYSDGLGINEAIKQSWLEYPVLRT